MSGDGEQDRMWDAHFYVCRPLWTTPYVAIMFGRYWRVSYGFGPFYGSIGYVEMF